MIKEIAIAPFQHYEDMLQYKFLTILNSKVLSRNEDARPLELLQHFQHPFIGKRVHATQISGGSDTYIFPSADVLLGLRIKSHTGGENLNMKISTGKGVVIYEDNFTDLEKNISFLQQNLVSILETEVNELVVSGIPLVSLFNETLHLSVSHRCDVALDVMYLRDDLKSRFAKEKGKFILHNRLFRYKDGLLEQ